MSKSRKESRQFYLSVEGINCEKLYFEHLKNLLIRVRKVALKSNSISNPRYRLKVCINELDISL